MGNDDAVDGSPTKSCFTKNHVITLLGCVVSALSGVILWRELDRYKASQVKEEPAGNQTGYTGNQGNIVFIVFNHLKSKYIK